MTPTLWIVVYCGLIVAASLLGGWLPSLMRLTHTRMQLMMSFVAGLMLGVSLLNLLPHAAHHVRLGAAAVWMLIGLLVMFFLVRAFHSHHHVAPEEDAGCEHNHGHEHPHEHAHGPPMQKLSWLGVAVGLSLHTAFDGVALGASVVGEAEHKHVLPALATFLAILLHKPLDALSITSLMLADRWTAVGRQLVNGCFALMCPLGAVLFYLGVDAGHSDVLGGALAFSAGVFLCIALGDLMPELHFHAHDRWKLSVALVLGVAAAAAMGLLEPAGHSYAP